MSLDHGMLNLPLAKRGNIDQQIDAYKAQQAADAARSRKVAAAVTRIDKAAAKAALAELVSNAELIASKAVRVNSTPRELIQTLTSWSKWEPARLVKLHSEWMQAAKSDVTTAKLG